jgi:hypothetical protein
MNNDDKNADEQNETLRDSADQMKNLGQALIDVSSILKGLPEDWQRLRVLKAAAALLGKRFDKKDRIVKDTTY